MMKQLNMTVLGAVAILTPFSALATTFNCSSNHPTCAQLGFNQTANECKGYKAIKCPFDQNALFCGDSTNVAANMTYNESVTCGTRDCDDLGYNRTEEECGRSHTRLACPFDDEKFYCGGYNCVAGDTLYADSNNNVGCWKGNDANGKTPIGFMLNDKVAIDLSFYGSAYSGENYVREIKDGVKGQVVWRNKGSQASIDCERRAGIDELFSSGSNVPCNGAPFTEIEVPYSNIFSIEDYTNTYSSGTNTFDSSGVAAMGGYYTTTNSNNGYYITNLLAQSGGFNINVDRFVPTCQVTAVTDLLTPNTPCLTPDNNGAVQITNAAVLNLKKDVVRQIHMLRELKKSVGSVKVIGDTIQNASSLPYMMSMPSSLTLATADVSGTGKTNRTTLINICKDLRRGNCATSIINAQSSFNTIDVAKPTGASGFAKLTRNRDLRPYLSNMGTIAHTASFPTATPWEEVKTTTSYFCSCAMKQVPQFPMMRAKEVTGGFFNTRMASISAAGEVTFPAAPAASLKRIVGVGSSAARLCADRTSGGQDWFLPAPGDIKNLMEDSQLLEKYRQALIAASNNSTVFPSGFNGQNLAIVKSPEVLMRKELGRTITSAMYLSNSSGTTSGVMCPLEQSTVNTIAKRDVNTSAYNWDLQLSLLGDVTHCVTLVGVDASQYESTAQIGKKHLCKDPILPAKVQDDNVINSIVDSRRNIVKGVNITDDVTASNYNNTAYHDTMDAKGL